MRVKKVVPKVRQKTYSRFKCWGPNCSKMVEIDWEGMKETS